MKNREFIEKSDLESFNEITIRNSLYWEAFFVLAQKDARVLFTRLIFLMREGLLARAEVVQLFCYYHSNADWDRDKIILSMVSEDMKNIKDLRQTICIKIFLGNFR